MVCALVPSLDFILELYQLSVQLFNFMNMNVKERIKERVNNINDPRLLDELLKAVELEYEIEHAEQLTDIEKEAIDKGISDAELGNLHSNSEASQLVKEWLKK